jgi:hypothetical protein
MASRGEQDTRDATVVSPAVARSELRVRLVVRATSGGVMELDLGGHGALTVGRSASAGIHTDVRSVSRAHARIAVDGDRVIVRDLASRNGRVITQLRPRTRSC